jgi:hypothetical protein
MYSDLKMVVFWVVATCSLVEVYRRVRGTCSLHHQGRDEAASTSETSVNFYQTHGATTQMTAVFILAAVRTSDPTNSDLFSSTIQNWWAATVVFKNVVQ